MADQTLCTCGVMGLDSKELLDASGKGEGQLNGQQLEERRMEIFLNSTRFHVTSSSIPMCDFRKTGFVGHQDLS